MKLDHIGVAVKDLDATLCAYEALGLTAVHGEKVEKDGVEVAFVPFAGGRFELLQPERTDSPVAKFLARRGPGLHHVALEVVDIRQQLAQLREAGVRLIDQEPRRGADHSWVAFIHPESTGGVLLELVERTREVGADG